MITLWELQGREGRRYSLFSWRARMALAHKGLAFETQPVCLVDKEAIAFSGGSTVPVIRDGESVVRDSWKIAEHLEARYSQAPSLFGGPLGHGVTQSFVTWVDRAIVPAMMPVVVADIHDRVDPKDEAYFRQTMVEGFLKTTLDAARAGAEGALAGLQRALEPLQAALKRQPFVCGAQAAYADYALFSVFQWARVMSPREVLDAQSPLGAWRGRVLDLHGGMARKVPTASSNQ
ncbi:MAG: glutathione S-transferase N-terminal domain-containing protein [Betaproteobacteria bacterium]